MTLRPHVVSPRGRVVRRGTAFSVRLPVRFRAGRPRQGGQAQLAERRLAAVSHRFASGDGAG